MYGIRDVYDRGMWILLQDDALHGAYKVICIPKIRCKRDDAVGHFRPR